jgi:hypothetical protein
MVKPPFQFGLKAVFVVMTAVAVLLVVGRYGPKDIANLALLTAWAFAELVALFAILNVLSTVIRVCGWFWKNRPFGSRNFPPDA